MIYDDLPIQNACFSIAKLVDDRVYPKIFKRPIFVPSHPEAYVDGEGNVKVSPMIYGRQEDALYLHGHVSAGRLAKWRPGVQLFF